MHITGGDNMNETFEIDEIDIGKIKKDEKLTIYVNQKQKRNILKILGYAIDSDGYIVSREKNIRIIASDNDEIKLKDVGIVKPANSPHILIKNNLGSLSEYVAEKE